MVVEQLFFLGVTKVKKKRIDYFFLGSIAQNAIFQIRSALLNITKGSANLVSINVVVCWCFGIAQQLMQIGGSILLCTPGQIPMIFEVMMLHWELFISNGVGKIAAQLAIKR